jgi:hypothetical protein
VAGQSETTVLEVDVVRFVAVVGLTLMVIFSLVHSLPYHGDRAEIEESETPPQPPVRETVTMPVEDYEGPVTARQQVEQEAVTPVAKVASEPSPATRSEERRPEALVLRFRNDDVFLSLLAAGKIQSFVVVPDLDLTYEVVAGHRGRLGMSLVYDLEAERIYRIPDEVVPPVLRQAIQTFDFQLAQRSDLVALVVLSDKIHAQVDELRRADRTGDFDILVDEQVVPKESS